MIKEILVSGGLRINRRDVILTIYSAPLARLLIDKGLKLVDISYNNHSFIIKPGKMRHLTTERKNENHLILTTRVGKIIPKNLFYKIAKKQMPVKVFVKDIADYKDLLEYNNQINHIKQEYIDLNILKSEELKVSCNISCFKNKSNYNYRLSIRHKVLKKIAIKKYKVLIGRNKNGEFIIRRDKRGLSFNLYIDKRGYPLAYLQISPSFITKKEYNYFKSGKRSISNKAYLSYKEFNLNISDFFMTKTERELAKELIKLRVNINYPQMHKREADIILRDSGAQIEVTTIKPRKEKGKNNAHGEGIHINAKLCEGYVRVTKGIVPIYFFVFDKKWLEYKWLKDLIPLVVPPVELLPTNFKINWEKQIAKKIKSIISKGILK